MMSVKTILLVENDQVSQTMYQKRLEREGFHMECAQDGQVALDILSERAPDLVLLDLMLPKVNGADVLRFMQADPRLTTVPVIIFSNAPLTEVPPDSALAQGTKRLLKSDCTFPKLLETIQESLAAAPDFVVVEANKSPTSKAARKGKGAAKEEHQDIIPSPDVDREIPKPLADFLAEAATIVPKLREHSMGYIKAPETEAGQTHLSGLQKRVHSLHTNATEAGCARVALLLSAFDNVLSGIKDKPAAITPSMLQTIAQAVDCLDGMLKSKDGYSAGPAIHARVLVVDDDAVCNQVNVTSLKRANFQVDGVKDPAESLTMLESTHYDIVVLDVNMPGLSGFDVCEKMRRLPHNKKTPVIFVTAFSSFDNRKQSVLSGGNDFVSKPVSPVELALKVTINLIKARVQGSSGAESPAQPAAINGASRSPQSKAQGKSDEQSPTDAAEAEPPSRLAPLPEAGTRNTRMAKPQTEPEADSAASPAKSGPAGKRDTEETGGADIHDRLRQSTAALESARANLEQESAERNRVETQWREQLNAAKALVSQTEAVLKDKEAQNVQLEKDLAGLRKTKDELQDKLTAGQQAAAKSQQEIKELQDQLRQRAKDLEHAKTTQEERTLQYTRSESELREQVNKAKAASDAVELARKEKEMRCGQLEKEVAGLQQAREELQNKLAAGQQAAEKLHHEIKELQVGLGQQTAEKMRVESEWRGKFEAANTTAVRTEAALKEKQAQTAQLEKDLTGLRQSRDELQTKFAAEQQATEKLQRAHKEKETRCGQLEKEVAGLQKDRDELQTRFSAEQQAAEKLLRAHKEKETRCGQLEKEVAGLQKDREELQTRFSAEQQVTAKSRQEIKELGERVQQNVAELERTKTSLEQESVKRTRLEAEQQNLITAREALNIELRALRETQAAREVELRNKQKKLAEGLRENIQLLQSKLQEAEALGGDLAGAPHGKSKSH
jgi:DNA-binding response OmpR family regulator